MFHHTTSEWNFDATYFMYKGNTSNIKEETVNNVNTQVHSEQEEGGKLPCEGFQEYKEHSLQGNPLTQTNNLILNSNRHLSD